MTVYNSSYYHVRIWKASFVFKIVHAREISSKNINILHKVLRLPSLAIVLSTDNGCDSFHNQLPQDLLYVWRLIKSLLFFLPIYQGQNFVRTRPLTFW